MVEAPSETSSNHPWNQRSNQPPVGKNRGLAVADTTLPTISRSASATNTAGAGAASSWPNDLDMAMDKPRGLRI